MLDLSSQVAISLVLHDYDQAYRKDAVKILFNVGQPLKKNTIQSHNFTHYHNITSLLAATATFQVLWWRKQEF